MSVNVGRLPVELALMHIECAAVSTSRLDSSAVESIGV
ncbi:hypothetical protein PR003_g11040 [Phytophthora rubi]|uniref:Uncharacterized protein n=1 Tax=Phytophthora rubi TaxID=129364 RepID=A0A6A3M6L5_9STRA|nr:hypothetical protein PR002_g10724 [Phytophthora rubi]KAE9339398.1 hypothetical protein PR003_g11040 [Phytophthora rubi]